uniref:cytochrome P450 81Q32-like n=1 Tax=Erigeron canadensis TaxID=72917 RepID=UPI001CB9BF99|nr:cytochrome P450 81Q32-like [Erigeron canadensis]
MEVLYLYISLIILLFSYLFTTHFRRKSATLPPTIFPSLPIIGHLYLFKPPLYRTLAKLASKYGPILYLKFGSRRVVIISSPSAVEECFTKNDIVFANRPKMLFGKIIGVNYTSLAWAPYGDNWRNLRRIASIEILSIHRLNEFHDIRVEEAKFLNRKLLLNSSSQVAVKAVFYELTLNIMMIMISGKRYFGGENPEMEEEGKRFLDMLNETFVLAGATNVGDYLPILSWLGVKGLEKRLIKLQEERDVFFQGLIEQLRKSKGSESGNKRKTMIEVLLALQESEPEYYTDAMIRSFVLVLLAAGSDTSATTMEWAMALMLNHPQVLKKAQDEIDRVVGNNRLVDESDIANLPYLRCIINETLRLTPPGPLLVPHEASEDCVVGGYTIPSGTMLLINQWAIHHDPKIWADPEMFKPERFEGLEGTRDGFKLLPFGSGRRSCPGEGLAVRVIGMTLGSVIQCFDWERMSEELVDLTEGPGLTMPKAVPLVAKYKPRPEMKNLLSQL